jgi:hypothetical protein
MMIMEIYESAIALESAEAKAMQSQFDSDLAWLSTQGIVVRRHDVALKPSAPDGDKALAAIIGNKGDPSFPVFLIDGRVAYCGSYPTRHELAEMTGLLRRTRSDADRAPSSAGAVRCPCCG